MTNPPDKKGTELFESDFRLIREIIESRQGKIYSTEYIRKIHNGVRANKMIRKEIQRYVTLKDEFKQRLKSLDY